jgi:hypothetical protein
MKAKRSDLFEQQKSYAGVKIPSISYDQTKIGTVTSDGSRKGCFIGLLIRSDLSHARIYDRTPDQSESAKSRFLVAT